MKYMQVRRHGRFGEMTAKQSFEGSVDLLAGGGTAAMAAVIARGFAPAGTFWARRTGTIAAVAGSLVALASRQKLTGILAALLVGGAIELVQAVTDYRVSHPKVS